MWILFLTLTLLMLAAFAALYLKAGLKAAGAERGLGLFISGFNPFRHARHIRRVLTSYRNACIEEGRPPWLARLASAALVLAALFALAAAAFLIIS